MKLRTFTIAAALALALLAAALGSASAAGTSAQPALPSGTWTGTGVISGSVTDAGGTTTFSGKLGFRIVVSKGRVKGTGSWVRTMKGTSEFVKSSMTGIAQIRFSGFADSIDLLWAEDVKGTIVDAFGRKTPVAFKRNWNEGDEPLTAQLVIKRVRKCSAAGIIPTVGESGVKITWTAKRLGCKS